jgi:hypothetical protein
MIFFSIYLCTAKIVFFYNVIPVTLPASEGKTGIHSAEYELLDPGSNPPRKTGQGITSLIDFDSESLIP